MINPSILLGSRYSQTRWDICSTVTTLLSLWGVSRNLFDLLILFLTTQSPWPHCRCGLEHRLTGKLQGFLSSSVPSSPQWSGAEPEILLTSHLSEWQSSWTSPPGYLDSFTWGNSSLPTQREQCTVPMQTMASDLELLTLPTISHCGENGFSVC